MSDLTEFLLARIEEDEQRARGVVGDMDGEAIYVEYAVLDASERRVLAECEAKRRIVRWHDSDDQHWGDETCCEDRYGPLKMLPIEDRELSAGLAFGGGLSIRESFATEERYGCVTLMMLAAVYAEHPDYRKEWVV